ncbi:TPA: isoprenylcysteine carboxylmethyltransferase family protein [Candidatus Woesearchaeota archaeon]|nr:isoprenylcysteine carboxylmethyltransferase family protein [Candidatus Woesearchaeota archaeon]
MKGEKTKERKSVIATGTMLLFFIMLYLTLRTGTGTFAIDDIAYRIAVTMACIVVVLAGTVVNIKGRYDLGKNWANHIKIYGGHTLITTGMYRVVRHPLYASLIWIAFAASIAYQNWLGVLLTATVFTPMMSYRARQEEELLSERFKEYKEYMKRTPRFFPSVTRAWRRA